MFEREPSAVQQPVSINPHCSDKCDNPKVNHINILFDQSEHTNTNNQDSVEITEP